MHKLLILDDNPAVLTSLTILLELNDYSCITAMNPAQGLAILADGGGLLFGEVIFPGPSTSFSPSPHFFQWRSHHESHSNHQV